MSNKRIQTNEFDFDTNIETVQTLWPNGSSIETVNNYENWTCKVRAIDCSSGDPEIVIYDEFDLHDYDMLMWIQSLAIEWVKKFDPILKEF